MLAHLEEVHIGALPLARFAPLIGNLSDRFGRRPILLASVLTFAIDNLICALATSYWMLFVGRILAGISGASFGTASAFIADVSDDTTRARNFGLIGIAFGTVTTRIGAEEREAARTTPEAPDLQMLLREMVERGDWLTPYFNYEHRWQKPVLYYWLTSLAYLIAGVNEWSARVFSALAGLGLARQHGAELPKLLRVRKGGQLPIEPVSQSAVHPRRQGLDTAANVGEQRQRWP